MDKALSQVLLRRGELLARIRQQRADMAALASHLERPLSLADHALSLWRRAAQHPYVIGGVAAFLLWRRRGFSGLLRSGFRLWRGLRLFTMLRNKFLRA